MKRLIQTIFVLLLLITIAIGCRDDEEILTEIELSTTAITMDVGDEFSLEVTTPIGNRPIIWTSSNADIVSVDSNGQLVGLSNGEVIITAMVDDIIATCSVTVNLVEITLNATSVAIDVGDVFTLEVTTQVNNIPTTWTSSNPDVVSVDANGQLTALLNGDAVITATVDDLSATCSITVNLAEIELNTTAITMEVSDESILEVITPINGSPITWTSSNPEVVYVDDSGNLKAKNSGSSIITATVEGISTTCNVSVEITIFVGGSALEFEAAYWKNGKINVLTTEGNDMGYYSDVNSIKVVDGTIYSGGMKLEQDPVVWKNNEEIIIDKPYAEVKELAVKGNEIYAVGGNGRIFLWSESEGLTYLSEESSKGNSIYVDNEDIYICGLVTISNQYRPSVWKNGVELVLDYSQYTWVTDVFASNGNFYVCGYEYVETGITQARYWENLVKTNLTDPSLAVVTSIVVENGTIYIAGSQNRRPAIWENGEIIYYEEPGIQGGINDVQFYNGDLYAAGSLYSEGASVGVVWKNGEEIFRSDLFDDGHFECIDVK